MTAQKILSLAALFGMLSVIIGAFAAHKIKDHISLELYGTFRTGVEYQFYHTLALLAVGVLALSIPTVDFKWVAIAFSVGILLFSGSLYLLACREWLNIGWYKVLGPITPLGGLFFIIGWLILFLKVCKI